MLTPRKRCHAELYSSPPKTMQTVPAIQRVPVPARKILLWASWKDRLDKPKWLQLRKGPDGWTLGCRFCAAAGHAGKLASFEVRHPVFCNLQRHQELATHKEAVSLVATPAGGPGGPTLPAPSAIVFQQIWDHLCTKRAHGVQPTACGTYRKTRKVEWCLAEARRHMHRHFLRTADVASLLQDGRHRSLLVKLVATNANLEVRSIVLGLQRDYGSCNKAVQAATIQAIQAFCIEGRGAPMTPVKADDPGGDGTLDRDLFKRILSRVEMFVADGAADEQLAGRELQQPSSGGAPPLPNLRVVLRDKAHASRRPVLKASDLVLALLRQ